MDGFRVERYANFGTGEPWVARIMLGLQELVFAVPAFGSTRDEFMNELGEVFESLGFAFQELRQLRARMADGAPGLELAGSYASMYGHLWTAHKDRFQRAMKALGLDIGFLFQSEPIFERRTAELTDERPELTDLISLMRRDRMEFQDALAAYRNTYLEHREQEPDPRMVAAFHRLDSAESIFENVWQAMEDYVALYVTANLRPFGIHLSEIPDDERDPACPKRFRFLVEGLPAS